MLNKIKIIITLIVFLILFTINCESYFVFHPIKKIERTPEDIGLNYNAVNIITEDEVTISGWWIPSSAERAVVLFCHGNAGNISHRLDTIRIFNDMGLSVFIFDYRGYGNSTGSPSEEGTYRDVEAAYKYLILNRKIKSEKIISWGRSLGGAVAAWLAANKKVKLLVLESTFTNVADVAEFHLPIAPSTLMFGDCYNTRERLKTIACPVLVIHSPDDKIIPYSHGERLFKSAKGPKEFIVISGGHNSGFYISLKKYKKGIDAFISRYLK